MELLSRGRGDYPHRGEGVINAMQVEVRSHIARCMKVHGR